jgi:hypothetical protein
MKNYIILILVVACGVLGLFFWKAKPEIKTVTITNTVRDTITLRDTLTRTIITKGKIDSSKLRPLAQLDTVLSQRDSIAEINLSLQINYFLPPVNTFDIKTRLAYSVKKETVTNTITTTNTVYPPVWQRWYYILPVGIVLGFIGGRL